MLIGAMNHPGRDPVREVEWVAEMGFEAVDLTLEPPRACPQLIDVGLLKSRITQLGLHVVGHTAYYLPLGSPFESLRRAAVEEAKACVKVFAALGASWMNLHPDAHAPFSERHQMIERNLRSIRDILPLAQELGVGLMLENLPGSFNTVEEMSDLLDPVPELGLHLDIGHGNLMSHSNTAGELIETYASRLRHVHIHDNKGGTADLHLPLGAGNIDVLHFVKKLQGVNYDAAITLEVFSQDRRLLGFSREVLRDLWERCLQASASGASLKQ